MRLVRRLSLLAAAIAAAGALAPAAYAVDDGRVALSTNDSGQSVHAYRDSDGYLRSRFWDGANWSAWTTHSDFVAGSGPAVTLWNNGGYDIYAKGTNNDAVYHKWWANGRWSAWQYWSGCVKSAPVAIILRGEQASETVAVGCSGTVTRQGWKRSSGYTTWDTLGGPPTYFAPAAVSAKTGEADVFITAPNGVLMQRHYDGASWAPWVTLGGAFVGGPTATSETPGQIDVFGTNAAGDKIQRTWNGTSWSSWITVPASEVAAGRARTLQSGEESPERYGVPSSVEGRLRLGEANGPTFIDGQCKPANLHPGSQLGLAFPNARLVAAGGIQRSVYNGAIKCFREMSSNPIVLRTQLAVDAAWNPANEEPSAHRERRLQMHQDLNAFIQLVNEQRNAGTPVTPIITIRGASSTPCTTISQSPDPPHFSGLVIPTSWGACDYPSLNQYKENFKRLFAYVEARMSGTIYSPWNEPDNPAFTLIPVGGLPVAGVERAGTYWLQMRNVIGDPNRMLAGEFGTSELGTWNAFRQAFSDSTGAANGLNWALHSYSDFLFTPGRANFWFTKAVYPPGYGAWIPEGGPVLSNGYGETNLSKPKAPGFNRHQAQWRSGNQVRLHLEDRSTGGTKIALYQLIPPAYNPGNPDMWDSALADRSGRARGFMCGLGQLTGGQCLGNEAPQTGNVQ